MEYILQHYPSTRDSDQELITMVWWYYHRQNIIQSEGKWFINMSTIRELEKPESITRCRRKFQEEGQYIASKEIRKQRGKFEEDMRQSMPQHGWEYADYLNQ